MWYGSAHCVLDNCRQELVESWADCTLQAASIGISFAPPLIVAQVYNMDDWHQVLRLLLIAPPREYLCLKFDPRCNHTFLGQTRSELVVSQAILFQCLWTIKPLAGGGGVMSKGSQLGDELKRGIQQKHPTLRCGPSSWGYGLSRFVLAP